MQISWVGRSTSHDDDDDDEKLKKNTQGDNTLSNLAMHSTHLLMKGVKDTMDFTKDFFNPFQVLGKHLDWF